MSRHLLVAGIGNIFLGDDGFGPEVARRLESEDLGPEVRVADFGIRGVHLAYELLEGYDALVLVDAVDMGEPPGTLAVIEPEGGTLLRTGEESPVLDAHTMSPELVLATVARLGGSLSRVFLVGCQPASLEERIGLSPEVEAAAREAAALCRSVVSDLLQPAGKGASKWSDVS
ncbi:MAG: hydrogenase maturation protease [Acidimicrobiales bacterium]